MNEVLLFFILKYKSNWIKVYQALEEREKISIEDLVLVNSRIKSNFISIIKDDYPVALKKIYKPPFGLFTCGNMDNLKAEKITLVGNFSYEDILPIINQRQDYALVMKVNQSNYEMIKDFAEKKVKLILIPETGIDIAIKEMHQLLDYETVLLVSEYHSVTNINLSSQPYQRILMGLSSNTIINYSSEISDINLMFEIAKQEDLQLYNFKNCPKKIVRKYNIKQIEECSIYVNYKN